MVNDIYLGWAAVVVSVFCFGSFGVPIKTKSVIDAKVDPFIFQSYKTLWVFITSFLVLTYTEWNFTPWGILSGLFWVPAGIAAIISVTHIGLGVAQGIWSGLIILVSFVWGVAVFKEPFKNIWLACLAAFLLAVGVVGMACSRLILAKRYKPKDDNIGNGSTSSIQDVNEDATLLPKDRNKVDLKLCKINKNILGYSAAIFNGIYGGSVMAPLKFAGDKAKGISFVVSFSIGAAIVTLVTLFVYCCIRLALRLPLPKPQFRVMVIPGSIAGILWALGNFFSIYAVLYLGEAVGYPSVQTSLIVGGLWGIFYYRELKGFQILFWVASALLALGGVVLLSYMKEPES